MKVICTQENLNTALNLVNHLASRNANLPILNNVLIAAENGKIVLSTTNLEIGIKVGLRGKIESEGSYTAPARLLSDYVSLLAKENITLELSEDGLNINCGKSNTQIKGMQSEDYPLIPEINSDEVILISSNDLKESLVQTIFSVSVDESRPEISGVFMDFQTDKLIIAATDSYRLAEKEITIKSPINKKIIVPLKTLQELNRILTSDEKKEIKIYLSDNQILFEMDNIKLTSRLIDGNYPDYKQIIPTSHKTEIKVKTDAIIKAIRSASLFCKPGINDVKMTILPDKGEVVIVSTNNSLGENITSVEADIKGEEVDIVFNYRYLLDGLNSLQSPYVLVRLTNQGAPGVFIPEGESNYVYIVMPIRQ